jgi:hypothetical protein
MTTKSEAFKKEHRHRKEYWQNGSGSLGLEPKRQNDLNDGADLEALAEIIKQVYYQDWKTAYSMSTITIDTAVPPIEMNNHERLIHTDQVHCICSTTSIFPCKLYAKLEMLLFFP